jgi:hypothetical protein
MAWAFGVRVVAAQRRGMGLGRKPELPLSRSSTPKLVGQGWSMWPTLYLLPIVEGRDTNRLQ